jgi:hypothetical protein
VSASQSDFTELEETGKDLGLQWDHLVKILHDLAATWNAVVTTGTSPNGHVTSLILGDGSNYKKIRLHYDGTNVKIDKNTGSDASPSWSALLTINASTLATTLAGALAVTGTLSLSSGLTLAGNLDVGGNDITNVDAITANTLNGLLIESHAARHAPGGADALPASATAQSVGATNSAGSSSDFATGNHVHAGVANIDVDSSGSPCTGAVNLQDGNKINVSKSGNNISFAFSAPTVLYNEEGGDRTIATAETDLTTLSAISITGADGSKTYEVSYYVPLSQATNASDITLYVYVGALGTKADGGAARVHANVVNVAAGKAGLLAAAGFRITPAASAKIGIAMISSAITCTAVSTTPKLAFLRVTEVHT